MQHEQPDEGGIQDAEHCITQRSSLIMESAWKTNRWSVPVQHQVLAAHGQGCAAG